MDDFDDDDDRDDEAPRSPGSVPAIARTAGIIWLLYGVGGLCTTLIGFVVQLGNQGAAAAGGNAAGGNPGSPCCGIAITIAFAYVGLQTFKGEAKDVLGNSIGSLIFGLLQFCAGVFFLLLGANVFPNAPFDPTIAILIGGVVLFMGSSLILAGTLALIGRRSYLDWRAAAHPKRRRRRRQRRDDDVDEERDDPRE
jgi:hypothetical protein